MNTTSPMTPIRLVSIDLDGTLLNRLGKVSDFSKEILTKVHQKGILIVINSGRNLSSVQQHVPEGIYDYVSCCNGQEIYCVKTGQHWKQPELTNQDLKDLYDLLGNKNAILHYMDGDITVTACKPNHVFFARTYELLQQARWIYKQVSHPQHKLITKKELITLPQVPKVAFCGNYPVLKTIADALPLDRFTGCFVAPQWYEVLVKGISKGNAVKQICEIEKIPLEETVGFGDGENDTEMLLACGHKIAMKNAMPKVKEVADEIADSHQNDGVAKWLQEHLALETTL